MPALPPVLCCLQELQSEKGDLEEFLGQLRAREARLEAEVAVSLAAQAR